MQKKIISLFACIAVAIVGCSNSDTKDQPSADGSPKPSGGTPAAAGEGGIALDAKNTKIEFVGTKPDGKHVGGFSEFSGQIQMDDEAKSVDKISVEIQTASLWSDNDKLTNHLKSPDFFNVNNHPTASFVSSKIETQDAAAGEGTVTGDLTLLGVTKEISFPATVKWEDDQLTIGSEFKIDRTEFGMNYDVGKVDPEVTIKVEVKAAVPAAASQA